MANTRTGEENLIDGIEIEKENETEIEIDIVGTIETDMGRELEEEMIGVGRTEVIDAIGTETETEKGIEQATTRKMNGIARLHLHLP